MFVDKGILGLDFLKDQCVVGSVEMNSAEAKGI